jgi:hypothetical protein
MMVTLVLAGVLLGEAFPRVALPVQDEKTVEKPVLPGEPGYVLKRAREMVELARCRDAERRTDLVLSQARERLREREAMGPGPFTVEGARVARAQGDAYRDLTLGGGAGTIECGVAEGRDMKAAQKRYLERVSDDRGRWERMISSLPPHERAGEESVLEVSSEAPRRSQAAEAAGLDFLKKEKARREPAPVTPPETPEPPKTPPAPPKPSEARPARPEPEAARPEPSKTEAVKPDAPKSDPSKPDPTKSDPDHPRKEEGGDDSRRPEHHPPHPHRPHH